jgi:hypothetical protein
MTINTLLRNLFDKIKSETGDAELKSDCAYYDASCAIRLNHANADEKMERFVSDFPKRKSNLILK